MGANRIDNDITTIPRIVSQSTRSGSMFVVAVAIVLVFVLYIIIRIIVVWKEMKYNRQCRSKNKLHHQQQPATTTTTNNNDNNNNSKTTTTTTNSSTSSSKSTLIVLGSGGHTTEIVMMTKQLNRSYYNPIIYCKAITDTTSYDRIIESTTTTNINQSMAAAAATRRSTSSSPARVVYDIPRSREVGQSFISSIPTTLYALYKSLTLVFRIHPDIIICNGPGTCIPIIGIALLYRILFPIQRYNCTIIFIESYCRVQSLSLTGKILYKLGCTDLFIVHWKELYQQYPIDTLLTTTFIDE